MPSRPEDPYAESSNGHLGDLPSRRERRYARRRSEILKATAIVLAEHGYHGTSLELVADHLDMAKATLYYYFSTKDSVIYECLATCAKFVTRRLRAVAEQEGNSSDRLRNLILEQLTTTTRDYPEMSRLFLYPLDWDPGFAKRVGEYQHEHHAIFRSVMDQGIVSGEFRINDVSVASVCMHGAMNQVPRWLAGRRSAPTVAQLNEVAETILRIFCPSEPMRMGGGKVFSKKPRVLVEVVRRNQRLSP